MNLDKLYQNVSKITNNTLNMNGMDLLVNKAKEIGLDICFDIIKNNYYLKNSTFEYISEFDIKKLVSNNNYDIQVEIDSRLDYFNKHINERLSLKKDKNHRCGAGYCSCDISHWNEAKESYLKGIKNINARIKSYIEFFGKENFEKFVDIGMELFKIEKSFIFS